MKHATKHAEELKSLMKRLMREAKPQPADKLEPLQALVRGAMSYDVPDNKAADAMKAIEREFVDLNELRVATELEVQELLGQRYPEIEKRVTMITAALNYIFEKEHTLSLERLKTVKWRDARQFLKDIPDLHPFVEAYVSLYSFDGAAVPVDAETLGYLHEAEIFEEGTTLPDAQKFLEHHLKHEECHPFFVSLRKAVYEDGKSKKKK
jgi:endonuclease III